MTQTDIALLAYVAWMLILVGMLGLTRSGLIMGGKASNSFQASGDDVDGFARRLTRAHANCYENVGAVAAVMLYAIATDHRDLTDALAYPLLGARVAQSVIHLISTSRLFVFIRFVFYVAQVGILLYWIYLLLHHS